jgi:hypothetical protein
MCSAELFPGIAILLSRPVTNALFFPTKKMKRALLFSLCLCASVAFFHRAYGQSQPDIFIRSFTTKDSIMLRWVPANVQTWKDGLKNGYTIECFTTDEFLDHAEKGKLLSEKSILPFTQNDSAWKRLIHEDEMNAFVFENIYSATVSSKTNEQTVFGIVLKSCDLSIATANACGLYFADKTALPGETYVYRISVANSIHKPAIINTDGKLSVLNSPEKIKGEFRDKKAMISFDVTSTRESSAGYIIERSDDSIHFTRINFPLLSFARSQYENEKTELAYRDTFPENHKTYWYRVRVYSYFGVTGPPSKTVKGKGRETWTLYPEADTIYSSDNKTVQLKWHLPDSVNKSQLKNFVILRSNSANGNFAIISSVTKNNFSDVQPLASGYYEIASVSIYNDTAFSYPYFFGLTDSIPPPVPENMNGTIDTNGIVHLYWNKVNAADLKGYRVFRSNTLKEEFVEVSDSILPDNFFADTITLNTLTKNVYYEVRSIDHRYNNSAGSKPYLLKRPDKIPPVAPLIASMKQTDSTICFSWINSSSDDVMCVMLKEKNTSLVLGSWNGRDTSHSFTSKNLVPGNYYRYALTVTDSSGNSVETVFPEIQFTPRILPSLKEFSAATDREKRMISLSWEKPAGEVDRYIIYKSKKGEPLRSWKTIDGKSNAVTDKELYPGNIYSYKIKAIMKSGAETKLVEVEVVY